MTTILGLFAVGLLLLLFGFFMGREDQAHDDDDLAELARERLREELRARLREIRGRR